MTDAELINAGIAGIAAVAAAATAYWQLKQGKRPTQSEPPTVAAVAQSGAAAIAVAGSVHAPIVCGGNVTTSKDTRLAQLNRLRDAAAVLAGQLTCDIALRDETKVGEALASLTHYMVWEEQFPDQIQIPQLIAEVRKETKAVEAAVAAQEVMRKGTVLSAVPVLADFAQAYFEREQPGHTALR